MNNLAEVGRCLTHVVLMGAEAFFPIGSNSHPLATRPSTRPPIHSTSSVAGHSASSGRQVASLDLMIFFQKSLFVIKFFLR